MADLVTAILNLICACTFILLIALMALRGRTSQFGVVMILCCVISVAWAGSSAFPGAVPARVPMLFDSLRLSAWLGFAVALIFLRASRTGRRGVIGATVLCALMIAYDLRLLLVDPDGDQYHPSRQILGVAVDVAGLLAIENLWRNTVAARRWFVWPLCLAVGGVFAYNLFLSANDLMLRGAPGGELAAGQAIVAMFMVPLLALAMVRNREWRIDLHVSRHVVLHSAALVASGLFLVAVGFVGMALHRFGGAWGMALQLAALIGSAFVLGSVLASGSAWRKLKFFVSHNFFSNRYDYRIEWLRFIALVSDPRHDDELQVRIICALAEFVDSPGGVLWSLTPGVGYHPTAAWRLPTPGPARLATSDPFVAGFRGGAWIQVRAVDLSSTSWSFAGSRTWLAVPLSRGGDIIGFVFLDRPGHNVVLDWESFDLLRAAGRQAASYLAEERLTKTLLNAELLNSYNRRFAFVVHDIKNLASQLGLVMTNARRHIDDPEFRRDMLQTVDDAVSRMNRLLDHLRAEVRCAPAAAARCRRDHRGGHGRIPARCRHRRASGGAWELCRRDRRRAPQIRPQQSRAKRGRGVARGRAGAAALPAPRKGAGDRGRRSWGRHGSGLCSRRVVRAVSIDEGGGVRHRRLSNPRACPDVGRRSRRDIGKGTGHDDADHPARRRCRNPRGFACARIIRCRRTPIRC